MNINFDKPNGFYFAFHLNEKGEKSEVSLVKLYSFQRDGIEYKGVGFGTWDGGGFVPLSDLSKNTILEPLTDGNGVVNNELMSLTMNV